MSLGILELHRTIACSKSKGRSSVCAELRKVFSALPNVEVDVSINASSQGYSVPCAAKSDSALLDVPHCNCFLIFCVVNFLLIAVFHLLHLLFNKQRQNKLNNLLKDL